MHTADFNQQPAVSATDLVEEHPGCTVAELVRFLPAGDGEDHERETARYQLNQALHTAMRSGELVNGPRRLCRERGVIVSTWQPAKRTLPGLASDGLGVLEDLMREAIAMQQAAA